MSCMVVMDCISGLRSSWNKYDHMYCCRVQWLRLWVVGVRPGRWFAWLTSRLVGVFVGELDDQLHRLSGVLDFLALT